MNAKLSRVPLAAIAALLLIAAPSASANIVWHKGGEIWAMQDNGGGASALLSPGQVDGVVSLASPHVDPQGSVVVFSGDNNPPPHQSCGQYFGDSCASFYGYNAVGVYKLDGGGVTRLSPAPADCAKCSTWHREPEATANGKYVFTEESSGSSVQCTLGNCHTFFSHVTNLTTGSLGGGSQSDFGTACNGDNHSGSPNPVNGDAVAYVGCTADQVGRPDPFPVLIVSQAGRAGERVVGEGDSNSESFDDPSWRSDGQQIVLVDVGAPNPLDDGLWQIDAAGTVARQLLQLPADGTRFAGPRYIGSGQIVFTAIPAGSAADSTQGDLWTIPASCNACGFPASATKLTAGGNNSEPAWTSAALPPSPTRRPAGPPVAPSGGGSGGSTTAACVVPKVKGMLLAAARRALVAANCALGKVSIGRATKTKRRKGKHRKAKRTRPGVVLSQTPSPGTQLPTGSPVSLVVTAARRPHHGRHHRRRR
jgi:PASTA domain